MLIQIWIALLATGDFLAESNPVVDEFGAENYLTEVEAKSFELCRIMSPAKWNYATNITQDTKNKSVEAASKYAKFIREVWVNVTTCYDWKNFKNETTKRQFWALSNIGSDALPSDKNLVYKNVMANMTGVYASTKVCRYKNKSDCTLNLEPEITNILTKSRDYDELAYYWKEWHERSGRASKPYFKEYLKLGNEAAKLNGLNDIGENYKFAYESPTLEEDMAKIWEQLKPFYQQLHAYVRKKLIVQYGANRVSKEGPIPAHLFGNMWSQQWSSLYESTKPFNVSESNIDSELIQQNYTVDRMFRVAESFFTNLGLKPMPASFWKNSIIERPKDGRDMVCHASAWDLCDGKDVRIKMCTAINEKDFITIHHEMGHIQYYLQYRNQPFTFRSGANPGFHEAIGDTIALSVSTSKHLESLNLSSPTSSTKESELNYLYKIALEKISFLPFGYLIDYYRWRLFRGDFKEDSWNSEWWKMRKDIQGIVPPFPRTEEDFDPAAKYHVAADVEYLRYFISFVIQFQFHEGLCKLAGEYDPNDATRPLHHCDINKNLAAGERFESILKLGSSKKWPEVLKMVTGTDHINAESIMNYFSPLEKFLREDNEKTGEKIGWD